MTDISHHYNSSRTPHELRAVDVTSYFERPWTANVTSDHLTCNASILWRCCSVATLPSTRNTPLTDFIVLSSETSCAGHSCRQTNLQLVSVHFHRVYSECDWMNTGQSEMLVR